MKKFFAVVLALCMIFSLVSCGGGENSSEATSKEEQSSELSSVVSEVEESSSLPVSSKDISSKVNSMPISSKIEVSSDLSSKPAKTVSVTVPGYLLPEEMMGSLTKEQKELGFVSMKQQEDYSITYEILESQYDLVVANQKKLCKAALEEIVKSGEFSSIKNITYNDEMTEVTVAVDHTLYEQNNDNWVIPSVAVCAMVYRVFKTKGNPDCEVVVVGDGEDSVISHEKFPEVLGF